MNYNLLEGSPVGSYIILGVMLLAIIALFVWQSISGKKKQKEAQDMLDSLKIGDRIKTIGGVCGFLVEINKNENTIVIETGNDNNKCYVKFDKAAIYQTGPANPNKPEEPVVPEVKAEEVKEEVKAEETAPVEEKAETEKAEAPKKKTSTKKKAEEKAE